LKKHVNGNHFLIARNFGNKLNNNVKNLVERQPTKKRSTISGSEISKKIEAKNPYKKDNVHHFFFKNLGIYLSSGKPLTHSISPLCGISFYKSF
jgi:hypothetical protein